MYIRNQASEICVENLRHNGFMKRLLLPLLAALALPTAVSASIDPEVHKLCLPAADYQGCIKAQTTKTTDIPSLKVIEVAAELNGKTLSPAEMLQQLNLLGGDNGIGRIDIVENRFVGMKSRGIYETPGGTILFHMRKAIESITLDKGASHLKDELMPKYAELIYNGFWFSPEREMLQKAIDESQKNVNGTVRAKLYKGNVIITGRKSPNSLYDEELVTFEEGSMSYRHQDAEGFIKLNALRLMMNKIKQT